MLVVTYFSFGLNVSSVAQTMIVTSETEAGSSSLPCHQKEQRFRCFISSKHNILALVQSGDITER